MTRGTCVQCRRRIGASRKGRALWHGTRGAPCAGMGSALVELAEDPRRKGNGKRGRPRKELSAEAAALARRWLVDGFTMAGAVRGILQRRLQGDLRRGTVLERITEIRERLDAEIIERGYHA